MDCFLASNQSRIQIRVDSCLASGHAIEGKPGTDFANPRGSRGNHEKLNCDQNHKDRDSDHWRSCGDKLSEREDHIPCRVAAFEGTLRQDQAG